MYTKSIIENEKELEHALNPNRMEGDDFPFLKKIELHIDLSDRTFKLLCDDDRIDISRVDPLKFLNEVLSGQAVELHVVREVED